MDNRTKTIQSVTLWGATCNMALTAVKLAAGIIGRSSAMLADAIHSLSDFASDIVVVLFARIAGKDSDRGHGYGHGKFETLATLTVSLMLLVAGVKMAAAAISNINIVLNGGTIAAPGRIALIAAALSIVVKEVLFQWTARVGKRINSQAMIANAWHHRSDALSSIGSLLGIGGAIFWGGKWTLLDPLAGVVISIFIIIMAVKMSIPALSELTDASLSEEDEEKIQKIIEEIDEITDVHQLKSRRCGHYCIVEAHIVVNPDMPVAKAHAITVTAEKKIREAFGPETQISLHIEPSEDAL